MRDRNGQREGALRLTSPGCIPVSAYAWTVTTSLILAVAAQTGSARPGALVELVSKSHIRNAELFFSAATHLFSSHRSCRV